MLENYEVNANVVLYFGLLISKGLNWNTYNETELNSIDITDYLKDYLTSDQVSLNNKLLTYNFI